MTKKDKLKIKSMLEFQEVHDGLPDGAFFALAYDLYGWDESDWVWFYENA